MAGFKINQRGIRTMHKSIQRAFDKQGPIRIPVETDEPAVPSMPSVSTLRGNMTVNNYQGPVFHGDVDGAQIAWNNDMVVQNRQNTATSTVTAGYEELAKFITDLLPQLAALGLAEQDRADAEDAATEVLNEITRDEPESGKLRRALHVLKGVLGQVAMGLTTGTAEGAQELAKTAVTSLSDLNL